MKIAEIIKGSEVEVEAYINGLPTDEVFTGSQLAKRLGITRDVLFRRKLPDSCLYRKSSNLVYFGHHKAIAALKKGLGAK